MFTKEDIEKYFTAEKQGGILFIVMGLLALGLALFFIFSNKSSFYKGASVPVILFSLVFLYAGYVLYSTSDEARIRNVYAFDMKPAEIGSVEKPRMEKLMQHMATYRLIEIGLFVAGVLMLFFFRKKPDLSFWYGVGVSLAISALVAHGLDFTAKKRARDYLQKIESFVKPR